MYPKVMNLLLLSVCWYCWCFRQQPFRCGSYHGLRLPSVGHRFVLTRRSYSGNQYWQYLAAVGGALLMLAFSSPLTYVPPNRFIMVSKARCSLSWPGFITFASRFTMVSKAHCSLVCGLFCLDRGVASSRLLLSPVLLRKRTRTPPHPQNTHT